MVEVCPVSSCFVVTSQPFLPGTTRSTLKFCHKSTIPNLSASIPECWIGWIYEGGGLLHTVPGTQAPVWVAGSFIQFHLQRICFTSEWWRNDFGWLAKGKSGKAITYHQCIICTTITWFLPPLLAGLLWGFDTCSSACISDSIFNWEDRKGGSQSIHLQCKFYTAKKCFYKRRQTCVDHASHCNDNKTRSARIRPG